MKKQKRGPGRPPIDPMLVKVQVGLRMQRWIRDWLRTQDAATIDIIENAVIKQHKLKPPRRNSSVYSS